MQRGTLDGGVIVGVPAREMDYTLDPTGNWSAYQTLTTGITDLNQGRVSNTVNEITSINASTGSTWVTPLYDPAGNMTTMPQPASPTDSFTATYDAWNRMMSVSNSGLYVITCQYDGRGRRIIKESGPETRHFYYTGWQDIEERVGTVTEMDKQYVWGVRYVDELVCRDDATPQRLYALQDANFNLTGISNSSGSVVERYLFDPYGNRTIMNASWGTITTSGYNWIIGHQGLIHDSESGLIYNRGRIYNLALGLFTSRDLAGNVDGENLYSYEGGNPVVYVDPSGNTKYTCAVVAGSTVTEPTWNYLGVDPDPTTVQGGMGPAGVGGTAQAMAVYVKRIYTLMICCDCTNGSFYHWELQGQLGNATSQNPQDQFPVGLSTAVLPIPLDFGQSIDLSPLFPNTTIWARWVKGGAVPNYPGRPVAPTNIAKAPPTPTSVVITGSTYQVNKATSCGTPTYAPPPAPAWPKLP